MSPEHTTIAVIALVVLAVLLFLLPHPCTCDKCMHHVAESDREREARRAERHRTLHNGIFPLAWGDPGCRQCRDGHERDRAS